MKKILIDCSLTGGRGSAKKAAEFIWECKRRKINYLLLTDRKLKPILRDFNLIPDFIVDVSYNKSNRKIYQEFEKKLKKINFDFLIKFGARTAGPYVSRKLSIPYIIIDGGLPDKYEAYPSLYDKETYAKAQKYILTTNFPWKPSTPKFLKNIEVCYFPISTKTKDYLTEIKKLSQEKIIKQISQYFTPFPKKYDLVINLCITDDYVIEKNRATYGAWLTNRQYDQVVGFVRRLVTDLGIFLKDKQIALISDKRISLLSLDLYRKFRNIIPVTWKSRWNYFAEIAIDAISDLTIARAANYQPFIFALARGNNITSPVPADGYMNEDEAAIQASDLSLTKNIAFDDVNYISKLVSFLKDDKFKKKIAKNQLKNFSSFGSKNNTIDELLKTISK